MRSKQFVLKKTSSNNIVIIIIIIWRQGKYINS